MCSNKGAGGDIAFISAYAPTADSKGKDKDNFYDSLAKTAEEEKGSFVCIGGDFNARMYEGQAHEKEEVGENIVKKRIPAGGNCRKYKG